MRLMLAAAKLSVTSGQQIIIFPEGTRTPMGVQAPYRPGVAAIARHYAGVIDRLVIDGADAAEAAALPCPTLVTPTVMSGDAERTALARAILEWVL